MWMAVTDRDGCDWVINIDHVVRFASMGKQEGSGTFVEMSTGTRLNLVDSYDSLKQVVLHADAKKAK